MFAPQNVSVVVFAGPRPCICLLIAETSREARSLHLDRTLLSTLSARRVAGTLAPPFDSCRQRSDNRQRCDRCDCSVGVRTATLCPTGYEAVLRGNNGGWLGVSCRPRRVPASQIEAVHRGFLYQHLYAANCLLLAARAGVSSIAVERDEDVEIVHPERRVYVQVKSRQHALSSGDIDGALERFATLRREHHEGRRDGAPLFVIASNAAPNGPLDERLYAADWPADIQLIWPGGPAIADPAVPLPSPNVAGAHARCTELASHLPFGLLSPESLVWKLAGCIAQASAGEPPRQNHRFEMSELPELFEQFVVQLQEFPAPPATYRAQQDEPPLISDAHVRLVVGYSGAGKTSWASEAASRTTGIVAYFDAIDTPGPALASAIARGLAARLFGATGGGLGMSCSGCSGLEILHGIGGRLPREGQRVTLVIDNAHRLPAEDVRALVNRAPGIGFVLLGQPVRSIAQFEALLPVKAEALHGWGADTVAEEIADAGCRADLAAVERLRALTGALPLYIQNALQITAREYGGAVAVLCADLEASAHSVETAQELILSRVFDALPQKSRDCLAILSLATYHSTAPTRARSSRRQRRCRRANCRLSCVNSDRPACWSFTVRSASKSTTPCVSSGGPASMPTRPLNVAPRPRSRTS